uniref:Uncharacterized protein n=1 Tax=Desulfatirhabdium butyrativorans TaxID=340467 RepID=A0A7C4MLG9_9BACT
MHVVSPSFMTMDMGQGVRLLVSKGGSYESRKCRRQDLGARSLEAEESPLVPERMAPAISIQWGVGPGCTHGFNIMTDFYATFFLSFNLSGEYMLLTKGAAPVYENRQKPLFF